MTILSPSGLLLLALSNATTGTETAPTPNATAIADAVPSVTAVEPGIAAQDETTEEATDPKWTGSINLGASFAGGNTQNRSLALSINAALRREKDRHTIKGWWNYQDDTTELPGPPPVETTNITARNAGGSYKYDYFLTEKTYLFGIAGGEIDDLAMLDLRWYAGGGVGRQFYEEEDYTLSGEVGITYFDENFEETAGVPSSDTDYIAARVAYDVMKKLSETTTFEQTGEIFPSLESSDGPYDVYAKVDTRLKVSLTERMIGQLQWIYEWDNTPAAGAKESDNLVLLSLGWTF